LNYSIISQLRIICSATLAYGFAYMEPNTYMDKSSPTYEHTASKKQAAELPSKIKIKVMKQGA